jgi:hypothetical protein
MSSLISTSTSDDIIIRSFETQWNLLCWKYKIKFYFGTNTKSMNLRIHEIVIYNQTMKIDTHEEKYFHSIWNIKFYNMIVFFSFDLFMVYIPKCKQQLRTMKEYTQIRDIAHSKSGVKLYYSKSSAIINDLDVILNGFMLQIIYTMVFWV